MSFATEKYRKREVQTEVASVSPLERSVLTSNQQRKIKPKQYEFGDDGKFWLLGTAMAEKVIFQPWL